MKLKELKIDSFPKYLDVKYAESSKFKLIGRSENEELNIENINKAFKEFHYYKYCEKGKDEECEHCHCIYAVCWFGREVLGTICGRRDK